MKSQSVTSNYTPDAPFPGEIKDSLAWAKRVREAKSTTTTEKLMASALIEALTELVRVRRILARAK